MCIRDGRQIKEQGWSLNPGRYVGQVNRDFDDESFADRISDLQIRFSQLSQEAVSLVMRVESVIATTS